MDVRVIKRLLASLDQATVWFDVVDREQMTIKIGFVFKLERTFTSDWHSVFGESLLGDALQRNGLEIILTIIGMHRRKATV